MFSFVRALGQCTCVLLLAQSAVASGTVASLTLHEAISRSLDRNLDLKVFDFELQAQQGRVQQAGARPPIEANALVENVLGSGARSGFDAAETTLTLGIFLEHGARQRRLDAANAGTDVLNTEARIRRLDLAAETGRRFVTVLEYEQVIEELRQVETLATETLKAVQRRIQAAKAPQAEEARAQAQLARVELDIEHAEHELAAARQRLVALWGETEADFDEARGDVMTFPPLEDFEILRSRIADNSDFDRLVSQKRLREAEVRLAEMRRRPPWQVNAGVRRFEDGDDHAFVVGLTVPFPARDQTQGAIIEAVARSAQVDAQDTALRVQLDAELFGLYQELRHAYAEVSTLRDKVLPRMEAAAEQSRYAYERGRYGYAEWVAAQRELLDLRRGLLQACADVHRHRIEIERLTGIVLSGGLIP